MVLIAKKAECTAAQLALAWCLQQQGVASVIVGAKTPAQLEENAAAADVLLSPALAREIDELFPV